jgi:hypothetical protein
MRSHALQARFTGAVTSSTSASSAAASSGQVRAGRALKGSPDWIRYRSPRPAGGCSECAHNLCPRLMRHTHLVRQSWFSLRGRTGHQSPFGGPHNDAGAAKPRPSWGCPRRTTRRIASTCSYLPSSAREWACAKDGGRRSERLNFDSAAIRQLRSGRAKPRRMRGCPAQPDSKMRPRPGSQETRDFR